MGTDAKRPPGDPTVELGGRRVARRVGVAMVTSVERTHEPARAGDAIADEVLVAGTRIGNYIVDALLGEGGFARVYRARHAHLGRPVAIKILRASLADSATLVERFKREAQAFTLIRHDNLVQVYDYGELDPGRPYFVMEWVDGTPPSAERARGALPAAEVVTLATQLAEGLAELHRAGLVHRDLKAGNVMRAEGSGAIKILDLGIVKDLAQDAALSFTGMRIGSPGAMSPEQIDGDAITTSSDIYSYALTVTLSPVWPPPAKTGFPWWNAVVGGAVLLILSGGARPSEPDRSTRPRIAFSPPGPRG